MLTASRVLKVSKSLQEGWNTFLSKGISSLRVLMKPGESIISHKTPTVQFGHLPRRSPFVAESTIEITSLLTDLVELVITWLAVYMAAWMQSPWLELQAKIPAYKSLHTLLTALCLINEPSPKKIRERTDVNSNLTFASPFFFFFFLT